MPKTLFPCAVLLCSASVPPAVCLNCAYLKVNYTETDTESGRILATAADRTLPQCPKGRPPQAVLSPSWACSGLVGDPLRQRPRRHKPCQLLIRQPLPGERMAKPAFLVYQSVPVCGYLIDTAAAELNLVPRSDRPKLKRRRNRCERHICSILGDIAERHSAAGGR